MARQQTLSRWIVIQTLMLLTSMSSCATPPSRQQDPQEPAQQPETAHKHPLPAKALELALGTDSYWVSYRHLLRSDGDYGAIEWLGDDQDNYVVSGRIMHYTQRDAAFPLTFGVGIGGYATLQDRPDSDAFAVSLIAAAHYNFATRIPTNIGIEFSYAPDITVWDDGERLVDGKLSYGVQLSSVAQAFAAYRYLEVDLTDGTDHEFANQLHIGVILAW